VTARDERKAQNREKLLVAARKVFAEKGVGAATARDIVRETDLATGTFYNYFEDKEDLFRAVLREFLERARVAVRAARRAPGASLEERIYGACLAYFTMVLHDPALFDILQRNAGVVAMMEGEGLFDAAIRELSEDMRHWVAEGLLPQPATALQLDYLANALVGAAIQLASNLDESAGLSAEVAADLCTRLFVDGIRSAA
jgi:AcrR family transcriptional regulator